MASKQELIKQAQDLGVIVEDTDTVKIITEKIIKAQSAPAAKAEEKKEPVLSDEVKALNSSLKRIKVTPEQLKKLQDEGKLVGWDPSTNEAIIK